MPMAAADGVELARSLRSLVETEALAIEEASAITPGVVAAIEEAGLFKLTTPQAFGGAEAHPSTLLDVCEELSFADGSVGWAYAQNITVGAYGAYLAPEFGKRLAEARTAAGMFAPMGVATPVDGGYRVQGQYKFGSGSGHADYVGGAATVLKDGEPVVFPNGAPPILAFVLPKERVVMKDNWDVMGLRGTGSVDFDIPEQEVDAGWCFPLFGAETVTGGPVYGLGALTFGVAGSVGWALGVTRRALHELAELAQGGRVRLGSLPLLQQETFQRNYGFHHSALASCTQLAHKTFADILAACERGEDPEARSAFVRTAMADSAYITRVCKAAVTWAWETSGSAGIRNPSVLQRCFRDIYVGVGHQVFDDRNFVEQAKALLEIEA